MRTWDLWVCVIVYTITFFWFGMWLQMKADQYRLKRWTESAWDQGCRQCAQFEKDACDRDQLQGLFKHERIPQ